MGRFRGICGVILSIVVVMQLASRASAAPALSTLFSFSGNNGVDPYGSMIFDSAGNLYGTTSGGGLNSGLIYKFNPQTKTLTPLASFNGTNGTGPESNLTFDSSGNLYISDYSGSASPQAALAPQLATGFANGTWTGPGINSDLAAQIAADPTNLHKTAIGYAEASDLSIVGTGTFDGQPVDDTTFILRYVFSGDANLDGTVDSNDFSILAANYGKTGQSWVDGDYNYDGTVNALDFNALATNYGQSLSAGGADVPESFAQMLVPEPGVTVIPLLLALSSGVRRNRTSQIREPKSATVIR